MSVHSPTVARAPHVQDIHVLTRPGHPPRVSSGIIKLTSEAFVGLVRRCSRPVESWHESAQMILPQFRKNLFLNAIRLGHTM